MVYSLFVTMYVQRYTAGIKSSMAFLFVLLTHTHSLRDLKQSQRMMEKRLQEV